MFKTTDMDFISLHTQLPLTHELLPVPLQLPAYITLGRPQNTEICLCVGLTHQSFHKHSLGYSTTWKWLNYSSKAITYSLSVLHGKTKVT